MIREKNWRSLALAISLAAAGLGLTAAPVFAEEARAGVPAAVTDQTGSGEETSAAAADITAVQPEDPAAVPPADAPGSLPEDAPAEDSLGMDPADAEEAEEGAVLPGAPEAESEEAEADPVMTDEDEAVLPEEELPMARAVALAPEPPFHHEIHEHTVDFGMYSISSALNRDRVLDVQGGSTANKGNIWLYQNNDSDAQKFMLSDAGDGYYHIQNVKSGKYFDVTGGNPASGTNVQQYALDKRVDYAAQRWIIEKNEDGTFTFISAINENATLTVEKGKAEKGANISVAEYITDHARNMAQRFFLSITSTWFNPKPGVYTIPVAADEGKSLDISGGSMANDGNLQIWDTNGTAAQKFIVKSNGDGSYAIYSYNSGKLLDVKNGNPGSGVNVGQYEKNTQTAQKWRFRKTGTGEVAIVSQLSGKILDVAAGRLEAGSNVQTGVLAHSAGQLFKLNPVNGRTIADGMYTLNSAVNRSQVIDVANGSRYIGDNIQVFRGNGTTAQKFRVTYKDGFYTIVNVKSKHAVEVYNGSRKDKGNVDQFKVNGTDAQNWIIRDNRDGSYTMINANSSKALDLANGSAKNGNNVQQFQYNGTKAQRFFFQATSGSDTAPVVNQWAPPSDQQAMLNYIKGKSSRTGYLIAANLRTHRLGVFSGRANNWKLVKYVPISCGAPWTPTVTGEYAVGVKVPYFGMDHGYRCWWGTQIWGDYLMHSVKYNAAGNEIIDGRLGKNISQGCIRMEIQNAKWIYDNIGSGTKVVTYPGGYWT